MRLVTFCLAVASGITLVSGQVATTPTTPTGKGAFGAACKQTSNKIAVGTYKLVTDCEQTLWCAPNNTCAHKGCRSDEYPLGYGQNAVLPDRCPDGQFCPDEADNCQALLDVGARCQLNRDDECAPPPNFKDLANGSNNNGSLCLNTVCTWANVTVGNDCILENVPYIAYGTDGKEEFVNVVSRGNCVSGLYCDGPTRKCLKHKALGATCTGDKECSSDNCDPGGVCGVSTDAPKHLPTFVYAIVAIGIIGSMVLILATLFYFHKRNRAEENEKRAQYWREQAAFRQNILQMKEQARASLLSLPWQSGANTPRGDYAASEHSHTPMIAKGSGLRNEYSDGGGYYDGDGASQEDILQGQREDDARRRKQSGRRV